MRPCQMCGCASWGPVSNLGELARVFEFEPNAVINAYMRCDNCNAVARADLVQDAQFTPGPITSPDTGAPLPDFMSGILQRVMPVVPAPPTRTERLVGDILRANPRHGSSQSSHEYARWIVRLARWIETELDCPVEPSKPWLELSFPARDEFERWCTGLLDARMGLPGNYVDAEYDRMVSYATKQQF